MYALEPCIIFARAWSHAIDTRRCMNLRQSVPKICYTFVGTWGIQSLRTRCSRLAVCQEHQRSRFSRGTRMNDDEQTISQHQRRPPGVVPPSSDEAVVPLSESKHPMRFLTSSGKLEREYVRTHACCDGGVLLRMYEQTSQVEYNLLS
uniref:Uncharacterized protein n=1 Tax=Grammatophora oceanica TaxID=210454 RepID=A0A7S1Y107_9STRA